MDPRRPPDATASGLMVLLCALWGTQQVAIKLVAADMPPLLQVALRSGLAALAILLLVLFRGEARALGGENRGPGMLAGVLFGVEFVLTGEGLRLTSAAHMAIFLYTAPVFAALGLQLRVPEERLTPAQWGGIAIAFAGVVLALAAREGGGAETGRAGDLLGLAAGAAWGASTLVVRCSRLARAPAGVTLGYQLAGAGAIAFAASLLSGQTAARITPMLLGSLAYQGLIISAASYLAWFALMRRYLASRLGILAFMTPIFGVGFGVAVMGDPLTTPFVLGGIMILGGILLVGARDLLAPARHASPAPVAGSGAAP
jgi:drug/metabolite transporter (DMT)-like permease